MMKPLLMDKSDVWKKGGFSYSPYTRLIPDLLQSLGYNGGEVNVFDLLPEKSTGFSHFEFLNLMAKLGYIGEMVDSKDYNNIKGLPLLMIPKEYDPYIIIKKDNIVNFTGKIYAFEEIHKDNRNDKNKLHDIVGFSWFKSLLFRYKSMFLQVFITSVILSFMSLLVPVFMMIVYDKVIGSYYPETLQLLTAGIVIALCVEFLLRVLRTRSMAWFGVRIDNIVSNAVMDKLLHLKPSFIEKSSVSSQIARIKSFEIVRDFFSGQMFTILVELPFILILILAIALIGGWIVMVPVVAGIFYIILMLTIGNVLRAHIKYSGVINSEKQRLNIEIFSKSNDISLCGAEQSFLKRYDDISSEVSLYNYKISFWYGVIEAISYLISVFAGIAVIFFSVILISSGAMSAGSLIALLILTWKTIGPMQSVCNILPRLEQLRNAIGQINKLMGIKQEKESVCKLSKLDKFDGYVSFYNVGLRYSKDLDPVFTGLNFRIEPGDILTVTGGNGSGKSTILKLIMGLYRPQAGSIKVDGVNIKQIDPIELRRNMFYMPQEPYVFRGSLAENIRNGNPFIKDKEIVHVLKRLDMSYLIKDNIEGIYSNIDISRINGFLKHQIQLARLFLDKSSILLLDELPHYVINSNVGEEFIKFIKNEKGRRTVVMITHRKDISDLGTISVNLYSEGKAKFRSLGKQGS